jgi:hypothetical protein
MMRALIASALVSLVVCQSYYPEITLKGEVEMEIGLSREAWVDPGYDCYNPLQSSKNKVDVTVEGECNLNKAGSYTVTYHCKNTQGLEATPKTRTITVDPKFQEDWWEGEAEIQIGGYDKKSFGKAEEREFRSALAASLNIPEENVEIEEIEEGDAKTNKMLKETKSINIHFRIKVVQEALIYELVDRMKDPKFDSSLSSQMAKQGLKVDESEIGVNGSTSIKKVIGTAVLAGLSFGAILGATFLGIGAYKLHQLANAGNINLDGAHSERSHLKGGVHDRL